MPKWKCQTCNKNQTAKDPGILCNLCDGNIGLECTSYSEDVYKYLCENNIEINFICKTCKETTIPELRQLLEITKLQQKLKEDIEQHDTRITKCEDDIDKLQTNQNTTDTRVDQIDTRLAQLEAKMMDKDTVETIAQKCLKSADFPPLTEYKQEQEKTQKRIQEAIESQKKEMNEVKKREDNKNALIMYGIPEQHKEDKSEQMKSDYHTMKHLYTHRVPLNSKDLLSISRVGPHKENQIRPIRITFVDMQKRSEILRNNKNLKIYDEELECNLDFCDDEDKHKHIYITTDKTKKERDDERKLREELKKRKTTEPDLIIRNGAIVKKIVNHARWSDMDIDDGLQD